MGARTGKEFLEGLRDDREVYLDGQRVEDVTAHPAFAGAARTVADLFDLQHAHPDDCLAEDEHGEIIPRSLQIPRSRTDLEARHRAFEIVARRTIGFLGRSPDYVNTTLAGFAGLSQEFTVDGNEAGAANLVQFHRDCSRHDWAMTHAIIHPTVDKSQPDTAAAGGEVAVHKVGETSEGIVVRGARALATLAPFADEMFIYAGQPIPREHTAHALIFSVPMGTPGLKILCRDSFSVPRSGDGGRDHFDHPFGHQFDEQDAVVIFDDVVIPWHRVFVDGSTLVYNRSMQTAWTANVLQQTSVRAMVKLEFAYELACRMVDAVGGANATSNELLGELWSYYELTRAAVDAAEAGARDWGGGVWFCDDRPFWALRPTLPRWFPRVLEILQLLGAHNLLATPTAAELADPALRPLIDRYYRGAGDHDAEERTRIFRTAWDFAGSALGSRGLLYERFYLASSARTYQMAHARASKAKDGRTPLLEEFWAQAERRG